MPDRTSYAQRSRILRQRTIRLGLEAEADLHAEAIAAARDRLRSDNAKLRLLERNPAAADASETISYWKNRQNGAGSPLLEYIAPLIERGEQPVFASISFCISAESPTNFVPVPYTQAIESFTRFRETLLVSSHEVDHNFDDIVSRQNAVRTLCHALANISYSIRLDDDPIEGWLGAAHAKRACIYHPDVTSLEGAPDIRTAAESEEPFLAMASVLYIPICPPDQTDPAPAVLMLWSPCPRRWDGVVTPMIEGRIEEHDELCSLMWPSLRWMAVVAAREFSNLRRTELELIAYFLAMQEWAGMQGVEVRRHFDRFNHSTGRLLSNLTSQEQAKVNLREWTKAVLTSANGVIAAINNLAPEDDPGFSPRALLDTPVIIKASVGDVATTIRALKNEPARLDPFFSDERYIALDEAAACNIGAEPAHNIAKYAARIERILVSQTNGYATISIEEEPRSPTTLTGTEEAFVRYYAARRGLAQIPADSKPSDGTGIGHWLFRILSDHVGVFSKLHTSPLGGKVTSVVSVRLLRGDER